MNFLKQRYIISLVFLTILWFAPQTMFGQQIVTKKDSVSKKDSISKPTDSISTTSTSKKKKKAIETPINYKANDSIVLMGSGNAYLYGAGNVTYEKIELTADFIQLNTDSSTVYAIGRKDKDGEEVGTPVFKDGGDEYQSKSLRYNMNTKKGYILHAIVQQGEGFIIGEKSKKIDSEIICMTDGKYTTCSDHDHPHFYLDLTKAKIKNKKWVVTGPAYLVLLDVPLPLVIPFGYFPFSKSYSSGIIVPAYGQDLTRGFYLNHGGYYFAISDYMDLALTGDLYTMGTWAAKATSSYLKKYKYNGHFEISYREDVLGDKGIPGYSKTKNFSLTATHAQDAKANPNSTLSASINYSSIGYDHSNVADYNNLALLSQNTKSSSISWTHLFPDSPFSLSSSILSNQSTKDSIISLTLPNLTLSMTRIYPFKRKNEIGKEKWYEKVAFSYTGSFSNSISTKENLLLKSSLIKDWKNGFDHNLPINMSFNLLKYISISPTVNYHERWYFQSISQSWDSAHFKTKNDTINKFYRVYDFSAGVSASTKLYGFYKPWRKLFGDKIDRIRHVMTPSIGFNFMPNFSSSYWNYYSSYQRPISLTDPTLTTVTYSRFASGLYGSPSQGKTGSLSFSLDNNLEMKVKQKNDTTAEAKYKTVSLIDAFMVSGSYNMEADSLKWSNLNANLRLKLFTNLSINLSGTFDNYLYGFDVFGNPVHIDKLRWNNGKSPRLINTGTSFGYTFNNDTFKAKKATTATATATATPAIRTTTPTSKADSIAAVTKKAVNTADNEGYEKIKIPWSLSFNYSVQYGNTTIFNKAIMEFNRKLTHSMDMHGNISLTTKWSFNFGGAYDITNKQITYTSLGINRNLHCWNMSANVVPLGQYKTYNLLIQVNSSLLSDIKYEKKSDYLTNPINWY